MNERLALITAACAALVASPASPAVEPVQRPYVPRSRYNWNKGAGNSASLARLLRKAKRK